jgi:drug/metabolite transporter (DMT)-like permease
MLKKFLPTTISAACYASAAVFVRFGYQAGLTPGMAIFLRFLMGGLILGAFLKLSGRWQALAAPQVMRLLLLGFLAYTVMGITWFVALDTTPAWLVALFMSIFPLIVSLGSWLFLREKIGLPQVAALAGVVCGGVLIFWQPFVVSVSIGVLLMSINVLTNAAYVLVGQRVARKVPPMQTAFWMIVGATCGTFVYALVKGELSLSFQPAGWLWVGLFAVVSTALAISLLWWGIGLLGPARAAIVGTLEPVFTILLAVAFLGEQLGLLQIAGAGLILAGVVVVRYET